MDGLHVYNAMLAGLRSNPLTSPRLLGIINELEEVPVDKALEIIEALKCFFEKKKKYLTEGG